MGAREKRLKGLEIEDDVRVRDNGSWVPAVVSNVWPTPRSYVVQTESGVTLRRNRRHLLKGAKSSSSVESDEEATTSGAAAPSPIRFELPSDPAEVRTSPERPTTNLSPEKRPLRSGRTVKPPDRLDL